MSDKRLELTREYAQYHYGISENRIDDPKMIVIHYTAFATFRESYDFMKPDELAAMRTDIRGGGNVNVGAHYLIDRNGDIARLLPDYIIARHTIGFNHVALSFENVGLDEDHLTGDQVVANAFLVNHLVKRHPSIEYLIGHYEYADRSLPHFCLFRELDASYPFTIKQDPGREFMNSLRKEIADKYGLHLKD